jgi:hypothetical protein
MDWNNISKKELRIKKELKLPALRLSASSVEVQRYCVFR